MATNRQVLLMLDMANPYHRKIAQGVATFSNQSSRWFIHMVHSPPEKLTYLAHDSLTSVPCICRADGIIASFNSRQQVLSLRRLKAPLVGVEVDSALCRPEWNIPTFTTNNEAIGRLGAEHFIKRGLTHLAFCGVPTTQFTTHWCDQRQAGFAARAAQAGLPCSVFTGGDHGEPARTFTQLSQWLSSLPKPVGVMAAYDIRACTILSACRLLRLMVPEEVAVLGVDNDELMCELSNPPLTSVEHGARNLGYEAAQLLDDLMAGLLPARLRHVIAPEGIVTRRSSDIMAIDNNDVAAALSFIRQRASTDIRVGDVAEAVSLSRSRLESEFRAAIGRSVHAEIQRVRLAHARQLVVTTGLPLKQVAVLAGFKHVQYMTTVFRRHLGRTPGEHRRYSRK